MTAYFNFMFALFGYGVLVCGALALVLLVLMAAYLLTNWICSSHPHWRVMCYAISVRTLGERRARKQFWDALESECSRDRPSAQQVIKTAMDKMPPEDEE